MRTLHLLRHAKSSWDDPSLDDHERPLAPRGERACRSMGAHLARLGVSPDLVICSSARRAVETWERLRPHLAGGSAVRIDSRLYGATASEVHERIREVEDSVHSLLLVGHEPWISELACRLARDDGSKARRRLERKFPTAACAEVEFEVARWSEIADGGGRLARFERPRDLERER